MEDVAPAVTVFPAADVATGKRVVLRTYYLLTALIALGFAIGIIAHPHIVPFAKLTAAQSIQLFLPFIIVATFIERAVEVFVAPWRAEGSRKLNLAIAAAKRSESHDALLIQQ